MWSYFGNFILLAGISCFIALATLLLIDRGELPPSQPAEPLYNDEDFKGLYIASLVLTGIGLVIEFRWSMGYGQKQK